MSATAYDALMSCIDPLIEEGYKIVISKAQIEELIYRVEIVDKNGQVVATEENWPLQEALGWAFGSTPEKDKVNRDI